MISKSKILKIVKYINDNSHSKEIWYAIYPPAIKSMQLNSNEYIDKDGHKVIKRIMKNVDNFILYIHVPFCNQKCNFCTYFGRFNINKVGSREYINYLIEQLKSYKIHNNTKTINCIYIGGGTPSLINGEDWVYFFSCLRKLFIIPGDIEITMELTPNSITNTYAKCLSKCGITRAQIGVQTFNEKFLKKIGRNQTNNDVYNAVKYLRKYGIKEVVFDLIFGFEYETTEKFANNNFNHIKKLNPDSVETYMLQDYSNYNKYLKGNDEKYVMKNTIFKIKRSTYFKRISGIHNVLAIGVGGLTKLNYKGKIYMLSNIDTLEGLGPKYFINKIDTKDSIKHVIIRNAGDVLNGGLSLDLLYSTFNKQRVYIDKLLNKLSKYIIIKNGYILIKKGFENELPYKTENKYINYFILIYKELYGVKYKKELLRVTKTL